MKLFKILLFIIITSLIAPYAFAGKGYDVSSISWSTTSGKRYCPSGKILTEQYANKSQARSGTAKCYIKDDLAPVINLNSNGYISGKWTKDDVNLNINITESGAGIKKIFYTINGELTTANSSFNLSFTDEGTYNISIVAEDKANYSSYDGSLVTKGNVSIKNFIVNIDKSAPVFIKLPNTENGWVSGGNILSFEIDDTYQGKSIVSKVFECGSLPENATWNFPVIDGKVEGFCDNDLNNCNLNSSFTPNNSACNENSYSCNEGYTLGNDGKCHINQIQQSCDQNLLPENVYSFNKSNILEIEGSSEGKTEWITPEGVDLEGNFISKYVINSNNYLPEKSTCSFQCSGGYAEIFGKCVNDVKIVCCNEPLLSENTFSTNSIDCTLPENQDSVSCSFSTICGWQKELFSTWNYSTNQWDYTTTTDGTLEGEAGRSQHCGFTLFENSDGENCYPGYYLFTAPNGKPISCEETQIGKWSGLENEYFDCTNKPNNSYYTSAGSNNDCEWTCEIGYTKKGSKCERNTWKTSNWSECSKDCDTGIKTREVSCTDYNGNILDDYKCLDSRPIESQECNTNVCEEEIITYSWQTTDWSTCDASCGEGLQTREVSCINDNTGEKVSNSMCNSRWKPDTEKNCINESNPYCSYRYTTSYYYDRRCNDPILDGDGNIWSFSKESNRYDNIQDCESHMNNSRRDWGECKRRKIEEVEYPCN